MIEQYGQFIRGQRKNNQVERKKQNNKSQKQNKKQKKSIKKSGTKQDTPGGPLHETLIHNEGTRKDEIITSERRIFKTSHPTTGNLHKEQERACQDTQAKQEIPKTCERTRKRSKNKKNRTRKTNAKTPKKDRIA